MTETLDQPVLIPEIIPQLNELNDDEILLINETIDQIDKIVQDATLSVIERVGELILSKIFNNNSEMAGEINTSKSNNQKVLLFRTLAYEIENGKRKDELPQKTWLYNAVNIVLDRKLLKDKTGHELYEQLSPSKRIELLKVKDTEKKLEYAKKTVDEKLSVRALRAHIDGTEGLPSRGLMFYLRNPGKIQDPNKLTLTDGKQKVNALAVGNESISKLENEIKAKQKVLDTLKTVCQNLENYTAPPKATKAKAKK